jgi:putative peptide zinc metalloprotease protein
MRLRVHGRRGVVVGVVALAAVLGLGLVASAELGVTGTGDSTASSDTSAHGNGDDNVAVAIGRDGKSVWAIRLKVAMVSSDVVDSGNAAVAAASCTDCQTVAIAIEGVLVTGDAEVVEPVNVALALNEGCENCQTLAEAYQSVIGTGGRVRITGEGRRTIADLRHQLEALRRSGLSLEQIAAEVDRIAGEFTQVLRTQIVPIGPQPVDASASPAASPSSEPSTQPTAEPSTEPTVSQTPSATPSG